jgi:ribonuclease HI
MTTVTIYTDGGSLGNPGPGGYGVVILDGKKKKELSGGFILTTNNRMELLAAIKGLEALPRPAEVTLYTDSRYLVDAINQEWVYRWKANRWMRNRKEKALNIDLWKKLLPLCEKHNVTFKWVKGHAGHPENERCDRLARQAAKGDSLPSDTGYNPDKKQTSFL